MLIPFPSKTDRFVPYGTRIFAHNGVLNELRGILKKEDDQIAFSAKYEDFTGLMLDALGTEHMRYSSIFEILKGYNLRSMKFRILKLGNLRILYCIEDSCVYLLTAFQEQKGGKADYGPAVKIATVRRRDIKGGPQ